MATNLIGNAVIYGTANGTMSSPGNVVDLATSSTLGFSFSDIFTPKKSKLSVKDVRLQSSTYGKLIPSVFGEVLLSGNIIWSSQVTKETTQEPIIRTKGGTVGGSITEKIRCSFALSLCMGVVDDIIKVYANEQELNLSNLNATFYYGTEDQLPNSIIQSYLGIDNTPAFRGLCYIVFYDFPLENYNGTIPNINVLVSKRNVANNQIEVINFIDAVNIIPGCGELAYDLDIRKKYHFINLNGEIIKTTNPVVINRNNNYAISDAELGLKKMQKDLPNLKWTSLVCSWFIDGLDATNAKIYPAVEGKNYILDGQDWSVAGIDRFNAEVIGRDKNGNPNYGGTPSDKSILSYVQKLKAMSYKVMFYPMLFVDLLNKPWRGHINGNVNQLNDFFNQYRNFILHYAQLLKNSDIDAFLIGSELKNLTKIKDLDNQFPFVTFLINLAKDVKLILGSSVKISYAADWSEYHHSDDGWRGLDNLWASSYIDFVGIDAYFPLTNEYQSTYEVDKIIKGWDSGEGFDFYYEDSVNKANPKPLSPEWAWKNLKFWWDNYHYNPNGQKTNWIPRSKKIWFTEYGFPSVDCCSNQPNVFYNPDSFDGGLPNKSKGLIDFTAQRCGILGTIKKWENSDMVEQKFLWCYDARPYPFYPDLLGVWSDGNLWKYGHWINGKIGSCFLSDFLTHLCLNSGLNVNEFNTSEINDFLYGYIIDQKQQIVDIIKDLSQVYNFDIIIKDGVMVFRSLRNTIKHQLQEGDLIRRNGESGYSIHYNNLENLPDKIEFLYNDKSKNYKINTINISSSKADNLFSYQTNAILDETSARFVAFGILQNIIASDKYYVLNIINRNINLLDIVSIEINNTVHNIRVREIKHYSDNTITISGNSVNENSDTIVAKYQQNYNYQDYKVSQIQNTTIKMYEFFNINNRSDGNIILHFAILPEYEVQNWNGCDLYVSYNSEDSYEYLATVNKYTTVGKIITEIKKIDNYSNSSLQEIKIMLDSQEELNRVINMHNNGIFYALIDEVEVISFDLRNIKTEKNILIINKSVRGRFNTENEIKNHLVGSDFIFINNNNLFQIVIADNFIGKSASIKALTKGQSLYQSEKIDINIIGNANISWLPKDFDLIINNNGDIIVKFNPRVSYEKDFYTNKNPSYQIELKLLNKVNNRIVSEFLLNNQDFIIYSKNNFNNDFGTNDAGEVVNLLGVSFDYSY